MTLFFPTTRSLTRRISNDRRVQRLIVIACFLLVAGFLFRSFQTPPTPNPLSSTSAGSTSAERSTSDTVEQKPIVNEKTGKIKFKPSSFDWTTVEQHFPVEPIHELPTGRPKYLPRVQHDFSNYIHDDKTKSRQKAVRDAFVRGWDSYKQYAWLRDELAPVTGRGVTSFGGWAATLVDALDTLWIMGLRDDFYLAAEAAAQLDWANTTDTSVNMFETTIRHLGGLLGAYDMSGEPALLQKAKELGNMLYMGFDTPNRLPGFWLTFEKAKSGHQVAGTADPSASPCSLSLEFTRLAQLTGETKFYDAVSRVTDFLERVQGDTRIPGMWPTLINFREERVDTEYSFTMGALADSLYEYLPKMAALLGGQSPRYERMHRAAMDVVTKHLLFRPMLPKRPKEEILFLGDAHARQNNEIRLIPDGQHLSCFGGGMFGLGGKLFRIEEHVTIGERLARGCAWAYSVFPTGLMPETFKLIECPSWKETEKCKWNEKLWKKKTGAGTSSASEGLSALPKGFVHANDPRYILRPEAIESIFLLYRMTGKEDLRELAWQMFESVMRSTKTDLANSAIANVTVTGETKKLDSMESFWFAETLKYFYLIFSPPDVISLDDFVFNTEAHPFRRPK